MTQSHRRTAPKIRRRKSTAGRRTARKRWSQRVTKQSNALDLKRGVFKLTSPKKIAASLKRSAAHSARRKTSAYRSAPPMLTFYTNRAGKTQLERQRTPLSRAIPVLTQCSQREKD